MSHRSGLVDNSVALVRQYSKLAVAATMMFCLVNSDGLTPKVLLTALIFVQATVLRISGETDDL